MPEPEVAALVPVFLGAAVVTSSPDWSALGQRWWSHVQFLADDSLEGRDTGSRGFEKAAAYMAEQFRAAGLQPAGIDGYRQPMDFDEVRLDEARSSLDLLRDGKAASVKLGDEAVLLVSTRSTESIEAEAVFVGYGLTVPELGHDDLAGQNVKGKIVVLVTGGPTEMSGPIKAHYQSPDERRKALRKAGVIGAVILQNPKSVEVPWSRLASARFLPRMELRDPGYDVPPPLPSEMVFNTEHADLLFAGSGHTFQEVLAALDADKPLPHFPLGVKIRARVGMTRSEAKSENVVGVFPGHDPSLKNEYVVVSAHLDHVGIGEPVHGDRIYSGAMDNASGTASLIEVARLMKDSGAKPKRSILFVAVTGEEKGLLGSQYFATHPTVSGPMVADLNMDMFNPIFPLKYLEVQGLAESTLGEDIRAVAEPLGVEVQPDQEPEHNLFIRSDQYSFIKQGVPALTFKFSYVPGTSGREALQGLAHRALPRSRRRPGPAGRLGRRGAIQLNARTADAPRRRRGPPAGVEARELLPSLRPVATARFRRMGFAACATRCVARVSAGLRAAGVFDALSPAPRRWDSARKVFSRGRRSGTPCPTMNSTRS